MHPDLLGAHVPASPGCSRLTRVISTSALVIIIGIAGRTGRLLRLLRRRPGGRQARWCTDGAATSWSPRRTWTGPSGSWPGRGAWARAGRPDAALRPRLHLDRRRPGPDPRAAVRRAQPDRHRHLRRRAVLHRLRARQRSGQSVSHGLTVASYAILVAVVVIAIVGLRPVPAARSSAREAAAGTGPGSRRASARGRHAPGAPVRRRARPARRPRRNGRPRSVTLLLAPRSTTTATPTTSAPAVAQRVHRGQHGGAGRRGVLDARAPGGRSRRGPRSGAAGRGPSPPSAPRTRRSGCRRPAAACIIAVATGSAPSVRPPTAL